MDTASVYDWFARDCMHAAEQTNDPRQREILLELAVQWAAAAQQVRDEASTQSTPPTTASRPHSGGRAALVGGSSVSLFGLWAEPAKHVAARRAEQ